MVGHRTLWIIMLVIRHCMECFQWISFPNSKTDKKLKKNYLIFTNCQWHRNFAKHFVQFLEKNLKAISHCLVCFCKLCIPNITKENSQAGTGREYEQAIQLINYADLIMISFVKMWRCSILLEPETFSW